MTLTSLGIRDSQFLRFFIQKCTNYALYNDWQLFNIQYLVPILQRFDTPYEQI